MADKQHQLLLTHFAPGRQRGGQGIKSPAWAPQANDQHLRRQPSRKQAANSEIQFQNTHGFQLLALRSTLPHARTTPHARVRACALTRPRASRHSPHTRTRTCTHTHTHTNTQTQTQTHTDRHTHTHTHARAREGALSHDFSMSLQRSMKEEATDRNAKAAEHKAAARIAPGAFLHLAAARSQEEACPCSTTSQEALTPRRRRKSVESSAASNNGKKNNAFIERGNIIAQRQTSRSLNYFSQQSVAAVLDYQTTHSPALTTQRHCANTRPRPF